MPVVIWRKIRSLRWDLVFLVAALAAGFGLRLLSLTNPPLDFHPTRQLRGAIIARGMYYQMLPEADPVERQVAIDLWNSMAVYEPSILERIVSLTYYLVGGEHLWIARLYSILFWLIGGLALYALARRMTSSIGSLVALVFYLFLPFGVIASRSFQPDPFMVMWLVLSFYSLYRWSEERTWKWALFCGLITGITALVKIYAAVFLAPVMVLMVLSSFGLGKAVKSGQVWSIAFISIVIPAMYYLVAKTSSASGVFSYWILSFTNLWSDPRFYFSWLDMVDQLAGKSVLFISLAGIVFLPARGRLLALGAWIGYAIYGVVTGYRIYTHEYYHLPLVPIMALSMAALISVVIEKLVQQPRFWRVFAGVVASLLVAISAWLARNAIVAPNYTSEAGGWTQMGLEMPRDGRIIALTHDYGTRLQYYGWIDIDTWLYVGDYYLDSLRNENDTGGQPGEDTFDQYFTDVVRGYKYFLVTLFAELDAQPLLKDKLYSTYPIYQEGEGYIIFDLEHPFPSSRLP